MKNTKNYLKYVFVLIPFFLSMTVIEQIFPSLSQVLLVYKLLAFGYIFYKYITNNKISRLDIALGAYCCIWIISAYFNNNNLFEIIKEIINIYAIMMIIEYAFYKEEYKKIINTLNVILFVLFTFNLIGIILYPNGLYTTTSDYGNVARYNFLGLDNQITPLILVDLMMIFIGLYINQYKFTIFKILSLLLVFVNTILLASGTAMLGIVFTIISFFVGKLQKKYINIASCMFIVFCLFLFVVIFRFQEVFAFIIEDILEKDLSLSNRTEIWDRAIELIKLKPIIGYGCTTFAKIIIDRNAHNFYLQILLQTGFIGVMTYFIIFKEALKGFWRNRKEDIIMILIVSLSGYMLCSISEVYNQIWIILILTFCYNSEKLIRMKKEDEKKESHGIIKEKFYI